MAEHDLRDAERPAAVHGVSIALRGPAEYRMPTRNAAKRFGVGQSTRS